MTTSFFSLSLRFPKCFIVTYGKVNGGRPETFCENSLKILWYSRKTPVTVMSNNGNFTIKGLNNRCFPNTFTNLLTWFWQIYHWHLVLEKVSRRKVVRNKASFNFCKSISSFLKFNRLLLIKRKKTFCYAFYSALPHVDFDVDTAAIFLRQLK